MLFLINTRRPLNMSETKYINPWYKGDVPHLKYYSTEVVPTEYRGFKVFQRIKGSFDYVLDGICLAQRCGFDKELIDTFYDDKEDWRSERMYEIFNNHKQMKEV